MEIIAKTAGGVIISATNSEVSEILTAVLGEKPKELQIGQKIPAIDYASTIRKIKELKTNYNWRNFLERFIVFNTELENLKNSIDSTSDIEP